MSKDTVYQYKVNVTVELTRESCCACGVQFAWPTNLRQKALDNHRLSFYCPNGHSMSFMGQTEAERLQDELEITRSSLAYYRTESATATRQARAYKGQTTKLKKRIAHGVCPVCTRTFASLERHMHNQHPEYADENQA